MAALRRLEGPHVRLQLYHVNEPQEYSHNNDYTAL
jgi:hypothetical protein